MDCGPTCLRMVAKHYGKNFSAQSLREKTGFGKAGVSLLSMSDTAEKLGFRTRGVKITFEQLKEVTTPSILHWDQVHFVVLLEISGKSIKIADPAQGIISLQLNEFLSHFISSKNREGQGTGIVLLLEPMEAFYEVSEDKDQRLEWSHIMRYIQTSKSKIFQVFIALFIVFLIQLVFPFLTQSLVDIGITTHNLQYVIVVLLAQLMLTFSQTIIGFIRNLLLLKISNIINIQILSDFWIKLTRLPVAYFDIHHTGDTLQRLNDNRQIQSFLTGTAINTVLSLVTFFVYSVVLVIYNVQLFFVFCLGSLSYFLWVHFFLRFRRKINYQSFHLSSTENNATLQLIQGMQELRLNNAEKIKRWEWENIQANLFKLSIKSLNYNQAQEAGATLISQVQGIAISFIVAKLVIDGQITLGAMLAVQYVMGQVSAPIHQWISFIQSYQDAKISMERLNEIHKLTDEEPRKSHFVSELPECKNIQLRNVSFAYPGSENEPVLDNINITFPEKKVTAIVGSSGCGKTTLIKLLLKVYEKYDGEIRVGLSEKNGMTKNGIKFDFISHSYWRSVCGVVLQDGFLFNDTILRNIALGSEEINQAKLFESCKIANIHSFIESLPNGYYTKLGVDGTNLSQGQRQRILIARAVYKNPEYLFFDEATNALDANNEKEIVENLEQFFKGKTVIVVAHRLSTVKNADKIIVMENGKIFEEGTHVQLLALRGRYYTLVKNQLDLSN